MNEDEPVCATCNQSVYVETGRDWEDGYSCHECELSNRDATIAELVKVLLAVEWDGSLGQGYTGCAVCGHEWNQGTHTPDCTLDVVLRKAGAR